MWHHIGTNDSRGSLEERVIQFLATYWDIKLRMVSRSASQKIYCIILGQQTPNTSQKPKRSVNPNARLRIFSLKRFAWIAPNIFTSMKIMTLSQIMIIQNTSINVEQKKIPSKIQMLNLMQTGSHLIPNTTWCRLIFKTIRIVLTP